MFDNTATVWTRPIQDADVKTCTAIINRSYNTDIEIIYSPYPLEQTTGLVLEHRDHGIIGCAIWNKETNHISSIGVLPEFRLKSPQLIEGMMQYAVENMPDQFFKGELLETTAYPLVKGMQKRGLLDIVEGGVSHYLDGVPCISVEMKPSEQTIEKVQNAAKIKAALGQFRADTNPLPFQPQKQQRLAGEVPTL